MPTESIKEISFTVARHDEHAVKFNKLASTVTFKLGLGPCGRFVESLEGAIDYHGVTVKQVSYPADIEPLRRKLVRACLDGADREHIEADIAALRLAVETKEFFYKLEDVRGRIVVIR